MTPSQFIAKWRLVQLTERAAAQQHFVDLCALVGHKPPAEADPVGDTFAMERGAAKHGGGDGWADVWKKGFFGWEYKGPRKSLDAAYDQLLLYREALENPPLLVVCDLDRIVVRTNFTATPTQRHDILLEALGEPRNLEILHAVFFAPDKLRPGRTSEAVTQEAAAVFAGLAGSLRERGVPADSAAHFLDRVVFCLFAEDIGLLPDGLFTNIVRSSVQRPQAFPEMAGQLFRAMAAGGAFGFELIRHFNGSLFEDAAALELNRDELQQIAAVTGLDWSAVDVSIFGTLFERGLDPAKRAQLGAHYTSRQDIELLVEPVIMLPLRRDWDTVRAAAIDRLGRAKGRGARKGRGEADSIVHQFLERLAAVKVLDPACGSGNFLYVTLQKLKDLEKEACLFAQDHGIGPFLPAVGPWQLYGIEVNPYAYDLALMTVWIGYLQWVRANGFGFPADPILRRLEHNFRNMDAILDLTDPANPREPEWPRVDFIVGNPPFLGSKMVRRELGDDYIDKLFGLWHDRVPHEADLCCYWFEKARAHIADGKCRRAGLLATQRIRTGANREVLSRITQSGGVFWAVSDKPWVLDGASVNVSMVAFDDGTETERRLDGRAVGTVNVNLTSTADLTTARRLPENRGIAFMGDTKVGPFDIPEALAREWLPLRNPHGKPNSDVLRPWANGLELARDPQHLWIIDFPPGTTEAEAARYEAPFEYVRQHVLPARAGNKRRVYAERWWVHGEARPDMRAALAGLPRYLATPCVSKHRLFVWFPSAVLPDHQLIVFARADDLFFGLLHSRLHEVWALATCGRLETRPQYTPTTSFDTFPFPPGVIQAAGQPPAARHPTLDAVDAAARALDAARVNWLGDRSDPKRTLTNLYNARPAWLANAHRALDEAVCAAYAATCGGTWTADMPAAQILEQLLALNLARAGAAH